MVQHAGMHMACKGKSEWKRRKRQPFKMIVSKHHARSVFNKLCSDLKYTVFMLCECTRKGTMQFEDCLSNEHFRNIT